MIRSLVGYFSILFLVIGAFCLARDATLAGMVGIAAAIIFAILIVIVPDGM